MAAALPILETAAGELLPARMLNEYSYCPRLAYLEWVQGEWSASADTVDGAFVHRHADRPDRRPVQTPRKEPRASATGVAAQKPLGGLFGDDEPGASATGGVEESEADEPNDDDRPKLHTRSLRLEDAGLGLVAVVDIVEVDGDLATPVDYKRGKAPDLDEGAWEPERVQLCAQGLLLRAAGFRCTEGVLWFSASRRRVTIPFDDWLVARTLDLIAECRGVAANGTIPPPLVDSPKCPRCSLVGICLPDETNLLALGAIPAEHGPPTTLRTEPRRLLAPRDDAQPLHVLEPGARIGKSAERLTVDLKDQRLAEVRLADVSQVCLYGNIQITTQALGELLDRGIPVCFLSGGGWFRGMAAGLPHKNIELRMRQHAAAIDPERSLRLARSFVAGKVRNGRTLLRRNADDDQKPLLDALAEAARDAERAASLATLLGIEGMAAKRYFAGFATLLKAEKGFLFAGRNRRPPTDPVNAVLSWLYSLLAKELHVACWASGLDPLLGFLHQPRYGRPALALDLAEEFRPLLADSTALSLFNTGELGPEHFVARAGAVSLTVAGRRAALAAWERRLAADVTHPVFGYVLSYRRALAVQARLLGRTLLGEVPDYPAFRTR